MVLEDFRGHGMNLAYLLRLVDRYPFKVERKGGYVEFDSKVVIINSNYHPEALFGASDEVSLKALARRIKVYLLH